MDILCTADMCPVILNATCVFYEGNTLIYTGITTNDSVQTALQKIDAKFGDAMVGYTFTNGVYQSVAGAPVGLGGNLIADTSIGGNFTLTFTGNVRAAKHITTGGTAFQFVKGDGTLDSHSYQVAGNYITALTGDVIAAGPGSVNASLAVVNSNPGTYGSGSLIPVVTVDTKGRVTALTTTAINVPSGSLSFVGDVYGSGTTGSTTTLTLTNVNSNVYTNNTFLKFKVNAKGLVTGATPVTHLDVEAVLGYVPVPETRTISINGIVRDLQTNAVFTLPGGGSVTSVSVTPGTGISASVTNPTTAANITITNTAPDQVVSIASGTGINVTGTYPNFTVAATNIGSITAVTASSPLASSGGTTPNITISQAGASTSGYLSSTDWNTFNGKQAAGSYITQLTGEATAVGPGAATVTLSTPAVTGKLLTGVNITGGTVVATDTILEAFGKVQNQINGLIGGSIYKGVWNASTNNPPLASSVGTQGWYYIVNVPGSTNLNGITDWNLGDWAIFDGTAWQQVDNTDAVVSVNGYTGAVSLVSSDVPEGLTNLYYTPARARTAISLTTTGTSGAATYDNITGVLNIPNYTTDLSGYVTIGTTQTITGTKTFSAPITASGEILVTNGGVTGATGVGYFVLNNASGNNNTAFGYAALSGGSSGNRNTAIGSTALVGLTTGFDNTAVGNGAGRDITTGNYNTLVGGYIGTSGLSGNVILSDGQGNIRFQWDGSNIKLNGNTVGSNAYTSTAFTPQARTLTINGTTYDLSANRSWTIAAGSGTVTSVGITMPSAFTVSNSPVTTAGTIAITGAGTTSQYIRGDGSLATYNPGSGGGGASQVFYFNGGVASGVTGYQQMSTVANTGASADFSVSSNGYIASFLTDSGSPNQLSIPAGNWNFEIYMNSSSSGGSPYFYVELYKYNGSFTLISSNSANPEYITNGTAIDLYTTALTVPATTLLATDRLAVRVYVNTAGRTITMHTQDSNLSEVITTFSTGITALNGLTAQIQNFAVGTSGSDFNISSVTDTHTFNLPTASATKRGALSTTDWTTFNSKQAALSGTGFVKISGTTISYDNSTYVDNSSAQSIAGIKTFTSGVNAALLKFSESGGFNQTPGYTQIGGTADYFSFANGTNSKTATFTYGTGGTGYTYTLPNTNGTLALTSALSTYVPYTGATGAVNLGAYDLTVNGIKVGKGAGNIYDNTRVGDSALASNTSGGSNVAIGYYALNTNTIAGANTAVGVYALSSNVSGGTNTAIGYGAGQSITTGSNNVIIGGYAGTSAMASNVILSDGGGNIRFQYNGTNTLLGQSGNVGIGTSSPAKKLDVYDSNGNATAQIKLRNSGSTSAAYLGAFSNNVYLSAGGTYDSGWTTDGTNGISNIVLETSNGGSTIAFGTANSNSSPSERLRLLSDGPLQFSTIATVPTYNNSIYSYSSNGYLYIQGGTTGAALAGSGNRNNAIYVNTTDNAIYFHTNNAGNRMTVSSSGSLFTNGGNGYHISFRPIAGATFNVGQSSGNIGTTGPFINATYNGTADTTAVPIYFNCSAFSVFVGYSEQMRLVSGGTLYIGGGIVQYYGSWSDRTLKENLEVIANPLEKISKLTGYTFDWTKDSPYRNNPAIGERIKDAGLIAQDVQEVLPEVVTEKDKKKHVNYNGVTALHTEGIKELIKENQELKNRLSLLEERLALIESKLL